MRTYPADEQRISEVEQGRACNAILPMPPGPSPAAGESIVFAHAHSHLSQPPSYVKDGDSVRVILTDVIDLNTTDPSSGHALFQLTWEPLGPKAQPPIVFVPITRARGVERACLASQVPSGPTGPDIAWKARRSKQDR
ncbi:MAG TPA: hypothetical protein VGZ22_24705 [Isosphaeraceae bacterium]|nr:hypothetical protein [Isosphaeraceae bacterium]